MMGNTLLSRSPQGGRVEQTNFNDYQSAHERCAARHPGAPDSSRIRMPLGGSASRVPPIAPALCNAIFAATGKAIPGSHRISSALTRASDRASGRCLSMSDLAPFEELRSVGEGRSRHRRRRPRPARGITQDSERAVSRADHWRRAQHALFSSCDGGVNSS